jgi:formyl-CoA transferase
MLLAIGNDGQFSRFSHAVGKPEWATDARFATTAQRNINRGALIPTMAEVTRTRTTADWVELLGHHAVPCGPINNIAEAFAEKQAQSRNLVVNQPVVGGSLASSAIKNIATVASPLRLVDTPPVLKRAPPALGQHTDEVLAGLGLDAAAIAVLRQSGVV